jgi:hypothetical protein
MKTRKVLDYLHQRRNTYGENAKSSRKNIRRNRAFVHRANRRSLRQYIGMNAGTDWEETSPVPPAPAKRWEKLSDTQLWVVVLNKLRDRLRLHQLSERDYEIRRSRIIQQVQRFKKRAGCRKHDWVDPNFFRPGYGFYAETGEIWRRGHVIGPPPGNARPSAAFD